MEGCYNLREWEFPNEMHGNDIWFLFENLQQVGIAEKLKDMVDQLWPGFPKNTILYIFKLTSYQTRVYFDGKWPWPNVIVHFQF